MSINVGGGELRELKPRILVMGVGGAGGNAINAISINTAGTVSSFPSLYSPDKNDFLT